MVGLIGFRAWGCVAGSYTSFCRAKDLLEWVKALGFHVTTVAVVLGFGLGEAAERASQEFLRDF